MAGVTVIFILNNKKLSFHMAQITEQNNSLNHMIHSNDQRIKKIVNLGLRKAQTSSDPISKLMRLYSS